MDDMMVLHGEYVFIMFHSFICTYLSPLFMLIRLGSKTWDCLLTDSCLSQIYPSLVFLPFLAIDICISFFSI